MDIEDVRLAVYRAFADTGRAPVKPGPGRGPPSELDEAAVLRHYNLSVKTNVSNY